MQLEAKRVLNWPVSLVIAIYIWPLLSFKMFFSCMMLEIWAEEFGFSLSLLSIALIQPITSLLILTATLLILLSAFILKKPSQRRKLGHIACVLGMFVLAAGILGIIAPMVQVAVDLM